MADTNKGYQYTRLQAPGTALVSEVGVNLHSGIRNAVLAGTVDLYDVDTKAGTAASNLIMSLGTATTMEAGAVSPRVFDIQTKKGLVVVTSGTLDYTVTTG